jgi:apolipoprotein N-acyltransferase
MLNQFQSIFSVLICVTNTFMASLVVENRLVHYILTFFSYFGLIVIIITQNFKFENLDYDSICTLVVSLFFLILFVPSFNWITISIIDE